MVKYNTLDEWFEGYVEPTMQNIYKGLNTDGVFATNIANYKTAKEEFEIDYFLDFNGFVRLYGERPCY